MALTEVFVPDIGQYKNVDVIEVLVKVGEPISQDQSLITLETDKATMEIPASASGIIKEIKIKPGDKVSQGSLILTLEASSSAPSSASQSNISASSATPSVEAPPTPAAAPLSQATAQTEQASSPSTYVHAGPAVRQLAREFGLDLSTIGGSGPKGRIIREDVVSRIKQQAGGEGAGLGLLPDPIVDFAEFGTVRIEKLPRIKKISGAFLARNWVKIPHITLFDQADITDLEAFRVGKKTEAEKLGLKLTPLPFLIKAVAKALKAYPIVNSSLSSDGNNLVFKDYIHIGVAVDTPHGLMVPVIQNADQKGLFQLAKELMEMGGRAREGKLKPDEMKGGCFTISSLGGLGTTAFTPIVNMPEVGILGVSRSDTQPKWNGQAFLPRLMMPLSLSLDHRVVDGAEGARFLAHLARSLADLRELLL